MRKRTDDKKSYYIIQINKRCFHGSVRAQGPKMRLILRHVPADAAVVHTDLPALRDLDQGVVHIAEIAGRGCRP